MKFITVSSQENHGLNRLIHSAEIHKIDIIILGLGKPYLGNAFKLIYLIDYLETLPANEIVLFTDAYDSIFLCSADEIKKKFQSFNSPLVFSAEQNFFLRGNPIFYLWQNSYYWLRFPRKKTLYKFLNSGSYIGEAGYILNVFKQLNIQKTLSSDQTLLTKLYIKNPNIFKLDHTQSIFACNGGRAALTQRDYIFENNRLKNIHTNTFPCILHTPGPHQNIIEPIYRKLFFPSSAVKNYSMPRITAWNHRLVHFFTQDNFLFKFIITNTLILCLIYAMILIAFIL